MAGLIKQLCSRYSQITLRQNVLKTSLVGALSHRHFANAPTPYEVVDEKADQKAKNELIKKVNTLVKDKKQGRLFAVVHVAGKQFKITEGDVIMIEGYWPPNIGDKLTLDKVLLAGGVDFTLIGTPVVQPGLIRVEATVIEKSLSHTKTHFRKYRRKQYTNINFYRVQQTMLRINKVQIVNEVNNPPEVRGLDSAIF